MHDVCREYGSIVMSQCYVQGRSQDFGGGGAEYAREARAQILATPTYKMERSKFKLSQRTRSDGS